MRLAGAKEHEVKEADKSTKGWETCKRFNGRLWLYRESA